MANNTFVCLALDPGKTNFGYSVLEYYIDGASIGSYRILECGMVGNTITELKNGLFDSVRAYEREICRIVGDHGVTRIVAERFVSRGLLGSLSEYVNIMIGISSVFAEEDFRIIIPATWKNKFNKIYKLDRYYEMWGVVPHVLDATLIGIYYISITTNTDNYKKFTNASYRSSVMKNMLRSMADRR